MDYTLTNEVIFGISSVLTRGGLCVSLVAPPFYNNAKLLATAVSTTSEPHLHKKGRPIWCAKSLNMVT